MAQRGYGIVFTNLLDFALWDVLIEFAGALLIVGYIVASLYTLVRTGSIVRARLIAADGVITGLSFKLAGTLLKTILIHTWSQILLFIVIFALRTVLKRFFTWERTRLRAMRT
jgi:uncharacterized membrane protein